MDLEFEFDGSGLITRLNDIGSNTKAKAHRLVVQAALEVELRAKHRAPKQYGFLRASIGHVRMEYVSRTSVQGKSSSRKNDMKAELMAAFLAPMVQGVWIEDKSACEVELGSAMAYARYQEYFYGPHLEGESGYMHSSLLEVQPLLVKALQEMVRKSFGG